MGPRLTVYSIVSALLAACASFLAAAQELNATYRHGHFYRPASLFLKLALEVHTDKVTTHNYDVVYSKYLELMPMRHTVHKFLEIGLGCNMAYGPGHSAALWRRYLPDAEVWMAEYNAECVAKHQQNLTSLGIKTLVGDQADVATLRSWVNTSGGHFDMIVDDGGHSNMQMLNSFLVLFLHALKPGGIYVIEDLHVSHEPSSNDGDGHHRIMDIIVSWIQQLVRNPQDVYGGPLPNEGGWPLPPGIKLIECSRAACVFTKCTELDRVCTSPFYDTSLVQYIAGNMAYTRLPDPAPPAAAVAAPVPQGRRRLWSWWARRWGGKGARALPAP